MGRALWTSAAALVAACLALGVPAAATAGDLSDTALPTVVTDGVVYSVAVSGDRLFVGGSFSRVGPRTGPAAVLTTDAGAIDMPMPAISGGDGFVTDALADGAGGWYVAGSFTHVGGVPRRNLAHIEGNGTVDPDFAPDPNRTVMVLEPGPRGTIYVGGEFFMIGGQPRLHIAAIEAPTGEPTSWDPEVGADVPQRTGSVFAIVRTATGRLFIGGDFTEVGDAERRFVAELDPQTGRPTPWRADADLWVDDLQLTSRGTMYVGGRFTHIGAGASSRQHLAEVDLTTGNATSWDPSALGDGDPDTGEVLRIATGGDGTVYVAGTFNTIGANAERRNYLAALDPVSAQATPWNPSPVADAGWNLAGIWALAVGRDGNVYVGGEFSQIGSNGAERHDAAALDPRSAAALPWDPDPNGWVFALVQAADGAWFAGGNFSSVGGEPRSNLAAVDLRDGTLTPWRADADIAVRDVLPTGDGTVYIAGEFHTVAGEPRGRIAALDAVTGAVKPWRAEADHPVDVLALGPDNRLYVGGGFTRIGANAASRLSIASLDRATGNATSWAPDARTQLGLTGGSVQAIAFGSDGTVYVGGLFSAIGTNLALRDSLAALDPVTGVAKAWNPAPQEDDATVPPIIRSIAVGPGGTVFAGGYFETIGSNHASRHSVAALSPADAAATPWNANLGDGNVDALLFGPEGKLYVGGGFDTVGGQPRSWLAAVDPISGAATAWEPGASYYALALDATSSGALVAGGAFATTDRAAQRGIAVFPPQRPAPANQAPPSVTGGQSPGERAWCAPGDWSGDPVYFTYAWQRDGATILDATHSYYTLQAADQGHRVSCTVTAHGPDASASARSAELLVPAPPVGNPPEDPPSVPADGGGGPPTSPPPDGTGPTEPSGLPPSAERAQRLRIVARARTSISWGRLQRHGLRVSLMCPVAGTAVVRLLAAPPALQPLGPARVLAAAQGAVQEAQARRLVLRLRRGVKRPKPFTARLVVTVLDRQGRFVGGTSRRVVIR